MLCVSIITVIVIINLSHWTNAAVPCNDTHNPCEEVLFKGSECQDGFCNNPFQGGCLRSLLESDEYVEKYGSGSSGTDPKIDVDEEALRTLRRRLLSVPRTCNSEDAADAAERGICIESEFDYSEVRMWSQNWETAFIMNWIMQIIYSEVLGVPSTIETGMPDTNLNFYDATNRMQYGLSNAYDMFRHAYKADRGDCTVYSDANRNAAVDTYVPCAHATMDVWFPNEDFHDALKSGAAEPLKFTGLIAVQGWHITKFSIKRDPSLASHFGLQGDYNRKNLAETFKRPTTWKLYCTTISPSNCTDPDDVAATRPPAEDGSEDGRYFLEGSYTGFFRFTEKNDCNKTEACTGHIMDFPCGWTSYVKQQTRHLGIALESDGGEMSEGYTYGEMVDIWAAANATQSDLIGLWWTPDATANLYKETGSDLTLVILPEATEDCVNNRINMLDRCNPSATEFDVYGDEKGSCGNPQLFTFKGAVGNMQQNIDESPNPKSQMSPAYDAYKDFTISRMQLDEILTGWTSRGQDKFGFDLRYATCKWMADNLDQISSIIPKSHPRTIIGASTYNYLAIAALAIGAIGMVFTIVTTCGILHKHRQRKLGGKGQIEFLLLLLFGLFLVSFGSILLGLEPSRGTCIGSVWMIIVGYTFQLVPTLIRVSTIIRIVRASMRMKVVNVDKKKLLTKSIGVSALAAIFCTAWTIVDPPLSQTSLQVTENKNDLGETIVSVSNHCESNSSVWFLVTFTLQGLLLICASVLAHQMRSVPNSVNDSRELAVMIYSSFMFLVLRFVVYIVSESLSDMQGNAYLQSARSIFCSLDTIANILIFFPRFFRQEKKQESSHTISGLNIANRRSAVVMNSYPTRASTASEHATTSQASHWGKREESRKSEKSEIWEEVEKEEEKEEEASTTIRFKRKDESIVMPRWVLEEYGTRGKT